MVYLCGRPLRNRGRCTLGRETAIQKMVWGEDGWLRTLDGQGIPTIETPAHRVAADVRCLTLTSEPESEGRMTEPPCAGYCMSLRLR